MRSLFARLHRRYGQRMTGVKRQRLVSAKMNEPLHRPSVDAEAKSLALSTTLRPTVAIVGGGFAGLMAGYALRRHCQVTVFEARSRVGGRVWSKTKSSGIVEAGGELIGFNHPLWLNLAKDFQLGLSVNTSDDNFDALALKAPLYLDGKEPSEKELKQVYREMQTAINRISKKATKVDPNQPWLAKNAKELDEMSLSAWFDELDCSDLTRLALEQQFSNDAGVPTRRQSFLANLAVVAGGRLGDQLDAFFIQSEAMRCSEGNGALADRLAAEIEKAGGEVRRCTPVDSILVNEEDVTLEVRTGRIAEDPDQACIFTELDKKQPITADYIVLAIPPSLWPAAKGRKITVTPKLPRASYVTMGTVVKYLSPLRQRFWIREGLAPTSTSSQFGVTWESTDNQIAPPGRDVGLSLFAGGGVAQTALRKWRHGGQREIDDFYAAKIGAIYDGYVVNRSEHPMEFMAWPDDPWTGAGYSCPAPGEVCRAGPLLHEPFHERLFFAGEHTCFAYFGYMEGALQSGRRAACSILHAIGRQQKQAGTSAR
jgi:monoamine oxidase